MSSAQVNSLMADEGVVTQCNILYKRFILVMCRAVNEREVREENWLQLLQKVEVGSLCAATATTCLVARNLTL